MCTGVFFALNYLNGGIPFHEKLPPPKTLHVFVIWLWVGWDVRKFLAMVVYRVFLSFFFSCLIDAICS